MATSFFISFHQSGGLPYRPLVMRDNKPSTSSNVMLSSHKPVNLKRNTLVGERDALLFHFGATPHNSRLTPCAPSRRPLHTADFEKMLANTQSIPCAFLFTIGAHWPTIRHAELRGIALAQIF
jgi:hypothetical protein